MKLENPYPTGGEWLRGNLHTHTTRSDGRRDPQTVIDDYADRGYDFLMISDHDGRTPPEEFDDRGMVLIPGNEVTARGPHLLHVNAGRRVEPHADRQRVLDDVAADDGLAILAHPNWHSNYGHYRQELMEELQGYVGIEIYNGVIERLAGGSFALDRWEKLLGIGRRVWGFANDDSHIDGDVELGWNVVRTADRSAGGIVDALRRGAFYASTGVEIVRLVCDERTLELSATEEVKWVVRREHAGLLHTEIGTEFVYEVADDTRASHVRVEAYGGLGGAAWTQPFFVQR